MENRGYAVGIVGTFDVKNFGDLLFPILAQHELGERLGQVRLIPLSYRAQAAGEWPFAVTSLTELPALAPRLDALIIGGGYLIRFDKHVAVGYGPPNAELHHPTAFWLTPALIAAQNGIPLLWNAPGVQHDPLPDWAAPLLGLALSQSTYIAVRDQPSRAAIASLTSQPVEVVPDTAFGITRCVRSQPSFDFQRLRDANGITGPYILVQGVRGLEECYQFLNAHADRLRGYRLVAIEIGPVNGDDHTRPPADLPGLVRLSTWPPPLLLAELIQQASAVIGPSYHLAVAALTAGVPVFSPANLNSGKFFGLAGFSGIHRLPSASDDLEWFLSRLGKTDIASDVTAAVNQVAIHWDRIAEAIGRGRTDNQIAIARFWQSLPGLFEAQAARAAAAFDTLDERQRELAESRQREVAQQRAEKAAQDRSAVLQRLLAIARSEIATRDYRLAQFRDSTSWKVTGLLRFIGKRLGR